MKEENVVLSPIALEGTLTVPSDAKGVVLFAHGSGSSRLSPRNRQVAAGLHRRSIGTLLFDLLTEEEAADRRNVFNIALLAERLMLAHDWLDEQRPGLASLSRGYFGASTGAAAALVAAAQEGRKVSAVVSRGGRPDLAGNWLFKVQAPTLLIVGGDDRDVLALNKGAYEELRCVKELEVIPGATHLFEEPGALEAVTEKAGAWFAKHL
jgi:putative phosphoribosyl transferase